VTRLRQWQKAVFALLARLLGLGPRVEVGGERVGLRRATLEATRHDTIAVLTPEVVVRDGPHRYRFRCTSHEEFVRVFTMLGREPDTTAWLDAELRPDDVFLDIGANIGAYTLYAAARLPDGAVYAVEPHLANARNLLANVALNGLQDRVRVLSVAVSDAAGFTDFGYGALEAGTAFSQLGEASSQATELKYATSVDALLGDDAIRPPTVVKIDVDGRELPILEGMQGLLAGAAPPRALQVELNPGARDELVAFMSARGYELAEQHASAGSRKLLDSGMAESQVPLNGVFRRA
jgi:FkbM family methyltransferase